MEQYEKIQSSIIMETKMEENICGEVKDLFFDKNIKKLNLELVKLTDKHSNYHYEIHFQDWSKIESKTLFKLHIKEAIELKSMIDNFIVDMQEDIIIGITRKK